MGLKFYDQQASVSDLKDALKQSVDINYRENGFRSLDSKATLELVWEAAQKIGVTRVARISELANVNIPVYQCVRPVIFDHYAYGLNNGSQGKGYTDEQAQISCLMEAIESFSIESRNTQLIRGAFNKLSKKFVIANPQRFLSLHGHKEVGLDEVIMWSRVYCPLIDAEVLIPAEHSIMRFLPGQYETQRHFPQSSNGLASGTNYLDAVIHGLYEVIERMFIVNQELGKGELREIILNKDDYPNKQFHELVQSHNVKVYLMENPGGNGVPCIMCAIDKKYIGYGCCLDVKIAVDRAVSEAFQSLAVKISGVREDMAKKDQEVTSQLFKYQKIKLIVPSSVKTVTEWKNKAFTTIKRIQLAVGEYNFKTLNEEYAELVKKIDEMGHPLFFIANLTREGVGIPVVKIISPTMPGILESYHAHDYKLDQMNYFKYRNMNF